MIFTVSFRKFFCWFFVFSFVITALPIFFIYSLSRTFLRPTFYEGPLIPGTYDFLVDVFAQKTYENSVLLQRYFNQEDFRDTLKQTFTENDLKLIIHDFTNQISNLSLASNQPFILDLQLFQQDVLKTVDTLAVDVFKALPICKVGQAPELNEQGIPTCVPENVHYESISAPLAKQFEKSIDGIVPGKMQIDFSSSNAQNLQFFNIFSKLDELKFYFFIMLFIWLSLIALIAYKPFLTILKFEGFAFFISGLMGFIVSLSFSQVPLWFLQQLKSAYEHFLGFDAQGERLQQFLEHVFSFFTFEFQKVAFFFVMIGAVLLFIAFFLRYNQQRLQNNND